MPRIHPRALPVQGAHLELTGEALRIRRERDLTDVEYLQWLASEQQSVLKYMLREERHGDPEKPAGWAEESDD